MRTVVALKMLTVLSIVFFVPAAQASDRVYYFHNDHLGTPQALSDAAGRVVWKAEYEPFGKAVVDEDPDGDGQIVTNNLRFPGQYYDAETGLHYNYHRDYDPATGRFLQPDPIGLMGGMNPYRYAAANPISFTDPEGLLLPHGHFFASFFSGMDSGLGFRRSFILGWNTALVDFQPGSSGRGAIATRQHGMAGLLPDGLRQTSSEAIACTDKFIQQGIEFGTLPEAMHAGQDVALPDHAGQPWRGFGNDWQTVRHIYGDTLPNWFTWERAYRNSLRILEIYNAK